MGKTKDQHSELEQLSRGKLRMVLSDWVVNSLDEEDYGNSRRKPRPYRTGMKVI